jgi:hypothetical protein
MHGGANMTLAGTNDVTITHRALHWIASFDASHPEPRLSLIKLRHRLADFQHKVWTVFLTSLRLSCVASWRASEEAHPPFYQRAELKLIQLAALEVVPVSHMRIRSSASASRKYVLRAQYSIWSAHWSARSMAAASESDFMRASILRASDEEQLTCG